MKSKSKVLISCMVFLGVNAFASKVFALDFNFTVIGDRGTAPGTVSGVIKGLTDNSSSKPTQIDVLSYPGKTGTEPIVLTSANSSYIGNFVVSNGNITAQTRFYVSNTFTLKEFLDFNTFGQLNGLSTTSYNSSGFNGATYTPATAVPWEFSPVQGAALGRVLKLKP